MADNQSRGLDEGKAKDIGDLTVTIKADVDVSDALTGLKAVQREAKAAVKALRELEVTVSMGDGEYITLGLGDERFVPDLIDISTKDTVASFYDLSDVPTKELSEELAKRNSEELTELLSRITEVNRHDVI